LFAIEKYFERLYSNRHYYRKVKERDNKRARLNMTEDNISLLYYIENVLDNVDWNKYYPQRPLYTTGKEEHED
jgi:hypothetical protein